ncbi:MAG TPA: formate dehydrogenase accessory sulfurtransferase FdhD, partial [Longimicrobiales bacterium]|nr:formate dehydrogenase accessory sulfurtransferase FdhD [Longimicrobiales bacterium]
MVSETPAWLDVNGERRVVLSCSPGELHELAAGHLLTEGWIDDVADMLRCDVLHGGVSTDTAVERAAAAEALRTHQRVHGCGLRHHLDCVTPSHHEWRGAPASDTALLLRALFAETDEAARDGGVHGAAISDGASLLHVRADVARHCAVDRVIGAALLAGTDMTQCGLVLTARVSGAIAWKAV